VVTAPDARRQGMLRGRVPSSGQGAQRLDESRLNASVQTVSMLDEDGSETHSAHYIWCAAPVQATTGSV
jgi:hypothetical protein